MLFNSIVFFVFLAAFLPLYFALRGRARLFLCLAASYFFYGWWDWRFLGLIAFSTIIDYTLGMAIGRSEDARERKRYLLASMVVNLGVLAFFKYFGFFTDSFVEMVGTFGWDPGWNTLNIILPVGISFYTFQSMSYTIDIYRRQIPVEPDFLRFATFISFFPQLVAGPIVRASEFLPQFQKDRSFRMDNLISGSSQMAWGFFKKVAVADSLAPFVDQVWAAPETFSGIHLFIGVIFYSFQIYCDFSGYSDIAIGLARVMGFEFPKNFRTPYFSQNFSEFWTRWHITLSSWLRDYLYISLGGNRRGTLMTYRNLMLTMLLGGLWHGAGWAFVFWGFLHGMYLVVQRLASKPYNQTLDAIGVPNVVRAGFNIALVYALTCFAWIYFRSPDFATANEIIGGIATSEVWSFGSVVNKFAVIKGVLLIGILLCIDLADVRWRFRGIVIERPAVRIIGLATLLWLIAFFGTFDSEAFLYFQF